MKLVRLLSGVLLVVVLLGSVPAVSAATPERGGTLTQSEAGTGVPMAQSAENASSAESDPVVIVNKTFSLTPEQPGAVRVRLRVSGRNLESLDYFKLWLQNATDIRNVDGFSVSGMEVEWRNPQLSPTATLTYTKWVNRTGDDSPFVSSSGSITVDTGSWALFSAGPRIYQSDVTVRYEHATNGPGAVGSGRDSFVYLGPHEEVVKRAHGQRFRLVVPKAADIQNESRVLSAVANTSGHIRFGSRDDSVLMVAAPQTVDWAVGGMASEKSLYTVTDPGLDTWIHEYVHTRQSELWFTEKTAWMTEATAEYYGNYELYRQGQHHFSEFKTALATDGQYENVTLGDPDSWHSNAEYHKGALVVGTLDKEIRLATDGAATFQTVLKRLTSVERANQSQFLAAVEAVAGEQVRRLARRYTETTATPDIWSRAVQRRAFGPPPGRVTVSDIRVQAVRGGVNRTVKPGIIVTGETVYATATVRNSGGRAATKTIRVRKDGETLTARRISLHPNETTTITIQTSFETPESHVLRFGGRDVSLSVKQPGSLRMEWMEPGSQRVTAGEPVEITLKARNGNDWPGANRLEITAGDREILSKTLRMPPNSLKLVTVNVTLNRTGEHTLHVSLGDTIREATLTVEPKPTPTPTDTPTQTADSGGDAESTAAESTAAGSGPGFDISVAVLALAVAGIRFGNRL